MTKAGFDAQACVIGAGAAGLAAGKALADRGISFEWFEKGSMVGGLWRIDNDNDAAAAYSTLHLNSSRVRTQYPSYPMPPDWPDFPSHTLMAQYFQRFAEDNGLLDRISFRTEVTAVEPLPGPGASGANGWAVTAGGVRRTVEAVLVANGHHSVPAIPEFEGEFSGESFHSHAYTDPSVFVDKDVLVVGVGNSGMDIACDAAPVARSVLLSTRHGVHVIPKYIFGRPLDAYSNVLTAYLPFPVFRAANEVLLRVAVGRPEDRGLPKPDHRLLHAHPTVSSSLHDRVGHGDIVMKPTVERLEGDKVRFVDGSIEPVDLLVYATGYRVCLPFLAAEVLDPAGNVMPLYQRVVAPDHPGLYFVGFIQTVGAGIPLFEYQAQWVGDLLTGTAVLPSVPQMRRWVEDDQAELGRRYVRSDRHTMQVDYWRYVRAMREARARKAHPSVRDRLTRPVAGLLG
jgi:dimethylaniline monooxygenase (N-oxide forming)